MHKKTQVSVLTRRLFGCVTIL